jgi:hypothetical protein
MRSNRDALTRRRGRAKRAVGIHVHHSGSSGQTSARLSLPTTPATTRDWRGIKYRLGCLDSEELLSLYAIAQGTVGEVERFLRAVDTEVRRREGRDRSAAS